MDNVLEEILDVECSAYDFKEAVEKKKTKSWLKSISAFANTKGGSLFFGIDDSGTAVGLQQAQADAEFISQEIKAHLDPAPDFELIPHKLEGKIILEVKVSEGRQTRTTIFWTGLGQHSSESATKVSRPHSINCLPLS